MAMNIIDMLDNASSATSGAVKNIQNFNHTEYGLLQVEISDTATAVLEGRVDSSFSWETVDTLTESGSCRVSLFPQMRVRVSAYTGGTIDAKLVV